MKTDNLCWPSGFAFVSVAITRPETETALNAALSFRLKLRTLLCSFLLFVCVPLAADEAVSFRHFGEQLWLQPAQQGYQLKYAGQRLQVELNNRLILKTQTNFSREDIKLLHPAIVQVQALASLRKSLLWLVHLQPTSDLFAVLEQLQQQTGILYAQPDLQQKRLKAEISVAKPQLTTLLSIKQHNPGRGVRVAVIDDGFQLQDAEQAGFRLALQYDADLRLADASPKTSADTHGGKVLQLLAQSAELNATATNKPELIAIRQVSSWTSDMLLAFAVARMMQADIVNSSWLVAFLPEPLFDFLTDWSEQSQLYLVFAAGNQRKDACQHNAFSQLKAAILVAAQQADGSLLASSNYGPCVDLQAPGTFRFTTASEQPYQFNGTSAAAAYVSGKLVRLLIKGQRPDLATLQQQGWKETHTGGTIKADIRTVH